MICKYCGNKIDDESAFCVYCGMKVDKTAPVQAFPEDFEAKPEKPKKKEASKLLPVVFLMGGIIIALIVALILIILFFSSQPSGEPISSEPPVTTQAQHSTEPETEPSTEPETEPVPEETETTDYYFEPYYDDRGIYYEKIEPSPLPVANPAKDIYDSPDGKYIGDFNNIGYYTIVERAEDTDGYTWGKLSDGQGWTMVYQQILPQLDMTFCSGAGAWATGITIQGTGFFSGEFHDSEMGSTGVGYPYGTVYTCDFDGKFNVTDIDEYTITLKLADIDTNAAPGSQWISDGVKYIASDPYGLEDCTYFTLYVPGTPASLLPEDMRYWLHGAADSGTLSCYALFNTVTGDTFVS